MHEAMERYRPQMPPASWNTIRDFVLQCAFDVQSPNEKWAIDLLGVLSNFARWAVETACLPLDRGELFHPSLIERFVRVRYESDKHRQLAESKLCRVGEALGEEVTPRRLSITVTDAEPYRSEDLPRLFSWALTQRSATTRRDAWALIGFGGGAGLRGVELAELRGRDITSVDGGFLVDVPGKYPRTIPVRRGWERPVELALDSVQPDEFVILRHVKESLRLRYISNFGRRLKNQSPRIARLRVTWIVELIDVLPLGSLVHVAGFDSAASLVRYLGHANILPTDQLQEVLRGPEVSQ